MLDFSYCRITYSLRSLLSKLSNIHTLILQRTKLFMRKESAFEMFKLLSQNTRLRYLNIYKLSIKDYNNDEEWSNEICNMFQLTYATNYIAPHIYDTTNATADKLFPISCAKFKHLFVCISICLISFLSVDYYLIVL